MLVGNDIVDLRVSETNSRWKEQRFLDKLFSEEEQNFIKKEGSRLQNIWLLWSMKESVYKIVSRVFEGQKFNPKDFEFNVASKVQNKVSYENQEFETNSIVNSQFIYTVATSTSKICSDWMEFNSNENKEQQIEIKNACIKAYSRYFGLDENLIAIQKNDLGVPQIYIDNKLQSNSISITHHGRYGGFAIAIC